MLDLIRTARVLRGTRSGSISKLSRHLAVDYDEAARLARPFVRLGILSDPNEVGFRRFNDNTLSRAALFVIALGGRDRRRRVEPNWREFSSYFELDSAAAACGWLDADAFLHGPFDRFLDLAGAPDLPQRARARIMEFARRRLDVHAKALLARNELPPNLVSTARARVAARFGGWPDEDYLLDVFDGRADHNRKRGSSSKCEE